MPITKAKFDEILQVGTIDTGNGTLFGYHDKRTVSTQRLMLVISTGGSGKAAIKEAMKTARQKLTRDFSNFVKFIVIDSASEELKPFEKMGIDTLNISSGGTAERLAPSRRPAEIKRFVPRDYPYQELNDQGSGQKRLNGKVKLYDKESSGLGSTNDSILVNKIKALFNGAWRDYTNLPLDIMILSGISGGNGSGTFMNIAALARSACPRTINVTVYGYLMLPDTAENFHREDSKRQQLYANGFAAIKELESYMSIRMEHDRTEIMERQGGEGNISLGVANPIFDYPVLLSGDYWNAVSIIAETIVNAAAESGDGSKDESGENNGNDFTQRSFYSNISAMRGTKLSVAEVSENGILRTDACPEDSHSYCSIGYAFASIPDKVVIPNIVGKISDKLYEADAASEMMGHAASAFIDDKTSLTFTQFEDAMRILLVLGKNTPVTERSLWDKILNFLKKLSEPAQNNVELTYNNVVDGQTGAYLRAFRVDERASQGIRHIGENISTFYDSVINAARNLMEKYGPRVIEYLYTGNDPTGDPDTLQKLKNICMKTQIQTVLSEFNREAQTPGKYPEYLNPVWILDIIGHLEKKERLQVWEGSARLAARKDISCKISQRMGGERGDWYNLFTSKYIDFIEKCRRFADVLETLADFYKGKGINLDADSFEQFASDGGGRNGVNLCSNAEIYKWVKTQVSMKVRQIAPNDVREAFVSDFFTHIDEWVSDEEGTARTRFDDVMSSICGLGSHAMENNGLALSITDFFNEMLAGIDDVQQQQQQIDNMIDNIMVRLKGKSYPSLKARNIGQTNITILVPPSLISGTAGTMIKNSIMGRITQADQFAESTAVDAIVCYQTAVAIAVADLEDLTKWENAYDRVYDGQMHLSNGEYYDLHMKSGCSQYKELTKTETDRQLGTADIRPLSPEEDVLFGTGLSWRHYPSVNVKRYYHGLNMDPSAPTVSGTTEGQYWDVFSRKVDQAVRYGIIECRRGAGNKYKYYINLIPNDWSNLDVSGYNEMEAGRFVRGERLFDYLKKQNGFSHAEPTRQIALIGSPFFGTEGFDLGAAQSLEGWTQSLIERVQTGYMKRMLRKMTGLYQELEDTLYRYADIEKNLSLREAEYVKFYEAKRFTDWFLSGVIKMGDGKAWSILVSEEGINIPLVTFDKLTVNVQMNTLERTLTMEKQRLAVVYLRYRRLLEDGKLNLSVLEEVKRSMINKMDPESYETMLSERIEMLSEAIAHYKSMVGSASDEIRLLRNHYKMDEKDIDKAEVLVRFFQAIEEAVSEQETW